MTKSPPSSCHTTPRREQRARGKRWKLQLHNKRVRRCLFRPLNGDARVDSPIVRLRHKLLESNEKEQHSMQDVDTFVSQVPEQLLAERKETVVTKIYELMTRLFEELYSMRRRGIYKITAANVRVRYNLETRRFDSRWDLSMPQATTPPLDPETNSCIDLVPMFSFLRDQLRVTDPHAIMRETDPLLREQIWWRVTSMFELRRVMVKLLRRLNAYDFAFYRFGGKVSKPAEAFYGFVRVTTERIDIIRCTWTTDLRVPRKEEQLRINGRECTCIEVNDELVVLDSLELPARGSWIEEIYEYTYVPK